MSPPTWDYEHAYPGGPMVAVRGFPRPLHAPGTPGYAASVAGSDVEGYKRTVSRLGRWPWQPFDQEFSKAFAHGKAGGNVGDSGVAGTQRQQGWEGSGNVGEQTFNFWRAALIPDGLPHAGEHGMDATSVELINAAWDRFEGKEPEGGSGAASSSAKARLQKAVSQIGVKESPSNSNQVKYCDWYGMVGPWCAMFVTWCDQLSGQPTDSLERGSRYAYVPYVVNDARLGKHGLVVTSSPKPGDLVCFDWSWDGEHDHIGIVETSPDGGGSFQAIEGNTSTSDNSNGGQVMRRTRNRNSQGTVFVRVAE